ncbi:glycosyl transferase family 2 [Chitinophaga niastensis]|uniref:Glycosyl transferase family 2 n=1 Tax=Chitinophaga niastensis TaxID=536980 RepID=A0A2P8HQ35_CHINA|nr:glycosyltransferase [Chitinophaga niastensis]PSL48331.1 glycosyl transferase family 2 [Chitinophaga niastensis]
MTSVNYELDYSIIICTYNPDERLLKRCLEAVLQLDRSGISAEVILVDNNSTIPVSSLPLVQHYLDRMPFMKTILVTEQGVKYARMAAIEQARGKQSVYFDYDNEPAANYLQELKKLNAQYPQVAAWGPGNIWVDFLDGIPADIAGYAQIAFQERHEKEIAFAAEKEWQTCYPFGTGLCTYTAMLKEYNKYAADGHFTLAGRKGSQQGSGEDTQMVLLCIKEGYAAGVAPALHMKHMIPGSRANFKYLQKLVYGTSICYYTCILEVFPEYQENVQRKVIPPAKFFRKTFKKLLAAKCSTNPVKSLDLINFIGLNTGAYTALNKPVPTGVITISKYLKLN